MLDYHSSRQCDDPKKLESCRDYLSLPCDNSSPVTVGTTKFKHSDKEAVHVDTLLCSTKLTQNGK